MNCLWCREHFTLITFTEILVSCLPFILEQTSRLFVINATVIMLLLFVISDLLSMLNKALQAVQAKKMFFDLFFIHESAIKVKKINSFKIRGYDHFFVRFTDILRTFFSLDEGT